MRDTWTLAFVYLLSHSTTIPPSIPGQQLTMSTPVTWPFHIARSVIQGERLHAAAQVRVEMEGTETTTIMTREPYKVLFYIDSGSPQGTASSSSKQYTLFTTHLIQHRPQIPPPSIKCRVSTCTLHLMQSTTPISRLSRTIDNPSSDLTWP
jgi:hypothetical protein